MADSSKEALTAAQEQLKIGHPAEGENANLSGVLLKLLAFTVAMVVLPVGSYFVSRDYYFGEKNTTPPAILAATIANVLLVSYVWMAIREDNEEQAKDAVKKVQ